MNQPTTSLPPRIQIVDSHTAGEPTRCVLTGLPDLGRGPLSERLAKLRRDHDALRRAILCEPRGSDVLVGAYVLEPEDPANAAAIVFFNNAGYLGMCGHGTIGVAVTLAHLGRIGLGRHLIETPVGTVQIELQSANRVSIRNVPAYRHRAAVTVEVSDYGPVTGDVAWGGNWFFLAPANGAPLALDNVEALTALTWAIRQALDSAGITGADGAEIDHIELYAAPHDPANSARNFVLCPGNAYDRSPCGTGTSAKLACLASDGELQPGETWRQEGILGTVFEGTYTHAEEAERIIPTITGEAYITAEATLIFDPADPFREGIGA
jgi:4-hydroxyproline epimerase